MSATIKSVFSAIAGVVLVSAGGSVFANGEPDFVQNLPKGLACEDFALTIQGWFPKNRVSREWTDEDGNVVRYLNAGKGAKLELINDSTDATYETKANGSVEHTTVNYDGSQTTAVTGHNLIIWFPTDEPPGPWTRLYVGRVEYTVDADGIWYFEGSSGREIDVCAALSE